MYISLYLPLPSSGMEVERRYDLERPDGIQRIELVESRALDLVASPRGDLVGERLGQRANAFKGDHAARQSTAIVRLRPVSLAR